jgi:hypothetical protein
MNENIIETTPFFWDCECERNYIHLKSQKSCDICKANHEDCSDSRVNEVAAFLNLTSE